MAVPKRRREKIFFLFPSSFCFRHFSLLLPFSLFSVFFSFCFRFIPFSFPLSRWFSLSLVSSLSPPFGFFFLFSVSFFLAFGLFLFSLLLHALFLFSLYPRVPLSFGLSLFIRKKKEPACLLLVRLQSRNGWSAIDAFCGGGGGEEREAGSLKKNKNGFRLCCCSNGGKEEDEQCRSKRHRSGLPLFFVFFIWNDVVLDKTRRFI